MPLADNPQLRAAEEAFQRGKKAAQEGKHLMGRSVVETWNEKLDGFDSSMRYASPPTGSATYSANSLLVSNAR